MTEQANQNSAGENHGISIRHLYLKDASFESPNSPDIFTQQLNPQINIEIETYVAPLQQDIFEVVLSVTATATHEEQTCFLVEVKQAGVFSISGVEDKQKNFALGVYCPSTLFPYVRQAVSDLVIHGGFPPLFLAPIGFRQMYEEKMRSQASEAAAAEQSSD